MKPFYDASLDGRVREARAEWEQRAQASIDEQIDQAKLERLRADAEDKFDTLRDEINAINEALRVDEIEGIDLPEPEIPETEIETEPDGEPLIDSDWDYAEASLRLIGHKSYEQNGSA
jgi:hypothetical protein